VSLLVPEARELFITRQYRDATYEQMANDLGRDPGPGGETNRIFRSMQAYGLLERHGGLYRLSELTGMLVNHPEEAPGPTMAAFVVAFERRHAVIAEQGWEGRDAAGLVAIWKRLGVNQPNGRATAYLSSRPFYLAAKSDNAEEFLRLIAIPITGERKPRKRPMREREYAEPRESTAAPMPTVPPVAPPLTRSAFDLRPPFDLEITRTLLLGIVTHTERVMQQQLAALRSMVERM
jgi:hypothetical protein